MASVSTQSVRFFGMMPIFSFPSGFSSFSGSEGMVMIIFHDIALDVADESRIN